MAFLVLKNKKDRCHLNRAIWPTLCLLSGSWLPIGCDRQDANGESGWGGTGESSAGVEARYPDTGNRQAEPVDIGDIRVLLQRSGEIWIINNSTNYSVWEGTGSQAKVVMHLGQGEWCHVRQNRSRWILESRGGIELAVAGQSFTSRVLEFRAEGDGVFRVGIEGGRRYRGTLKCIREMEGQISLVNTLPVESYLAGVVGAEMPASWDAAAVQVQTIASRTYCLYQKQSRDGRGDWDIGSNQNSQVYMGLEMEHRRVEAALEETKGVVLAFGPVGAEKIFPSYYSSICGGHTQDSTEVYGEGFEPMSGSACPYCAVSAKPELFRWDTVEYEKKTVSERLLERDANFAILGDIEGIGVTKLSSYGRVEELELTGSSGEKMTISAEKFRVAISRREEPLRSSWYELRDGGRTWHFENGRGWGHGVGLCQYGSKEMAEQGYDCKAILRHYYPGAVIVRAY